MHLEFVNLNDPKVFINFYLIFFITAWLRRKCQLPVEVHNYYSVIPLKVYYSVTAINYSITTLKLIGQACSKESEESVDLLMDLGMLNSLICLIFLNYYSYDYCWAARWYSG